MLTYIRLHNKAFWIYLAIILSLYYDPVMATNLMDVVNYALYNHPTILFNEQLVDESKYRYYQTFGPFLPEVSLTRNQNSEKTLNTSNGINAPVYLRARNNDFNLKQNLFAGFKDLHANRAAMWRYKSKRESAVFNINAQIFDIIVNYINILQQEKLLGLAKENESFFQKSLDKLEKLYNKGVADKADFLLVKNNLQNAKTNTLQAKKDYDTARNKFKNLIDLEPTNLQPLKSISKYINQDLEKIIESIINNNPNIKEIEAKIKTLEHEFKQSASSLMPSIDLQLSKNQASNLNGSKGISSNTKIGVTLNLNLLKGGQDYLEIQAKHAEKLSLKHQLEQTRRAIKQDVSETWLNIKNAVDKKQSIDDQIISAKQSLNSYMILFDYNRSYLLNVLNSKKLLLTSKTEQITNNSTKLINEYRILLLNNCLLDTIENVYIPPQSTVPKDLKKHENPSTDMPPPVLNNQGSTPKEIDKIEKPEKEKVYIADKPDKLLEQSSSYKLFIQDYEAFTQNTDILPKIKKLNKDSNNKDSTKNQEFIKEYLNDYEIFLNLKSTTSQLIANKSNISNQKKIPDVNLNKLNNNSSCKSLNKNQEFIKEYLNDYEIFLNSKTTNTPTAIPNISSAATSTITPPIKNNNNTNLNNPNKKLSKINITDHINNYDDFLKHITQNTSNPGSIDNKQSIDNIKSNKNQQQQF